MSSDPFAPIPLFAFPLYHSTIVGHEQHDQPLAAEILELRSKHPGVRRSNRNAWHSPDRFNPSSEHLRWVLGNATAFAQRALAPYYQGWSAVDLRLTQYWANVVGPGGWNAPHHHFPYHWSGVYYVSAPVSGGTPDELDGMIEFLNPTPWHAVWGRSGNYAQRPQDGMMLLFPASLVHFVHPHTAEAPRISIAFNFQVMPKATGAR